MKSSRASGFMLVAALLITGLFLATGLGIMSAQASRYEASAKLADTLQAKNAALAGLDDVRVKLSKDVRFPPRKAKGRGQQRFAYSETLAEADPATGQPELSYAVTVDYGYEEEVQIRTRPLPFRWGLYRLTVSGYVGPRAEPIAQSMLYAEYHIGTGSLIRFEDRSSL